MIKAFEIQNNVGDVLKIELRNPEKSGFLITNVTGLTLPEAEVSSYEYAMFDGSFVSNTRVRPRNIVFSITYFAPNDKKRSIEELRYWCHRYFPVKQKVTILIYMDDSDNLVTCTLYSIEGYVEANETNIFSKSEGSQVSIICPDPYFKKYAPMEIAETVGYQSLILADDDTNNETMVIPDTGHSNAAYESILDLNSEAILINFPGNVVSVPSSPNMFMRNEFKHFYITYPSSNIYYEGSNEAGMIIQIYASGNAGEIRINNATRGEKLIINTNLIEDLTSSELQDGDIIEINTEKGNKYASLKREDTTYNILDAIDNTSKWPCVQHGNNNITFTALSGIENLEVEIRISTRVLGI